MEAARGRQRRAVGPRWRARAQFGRQREQVGIDERFFQQRRHLAQAQMMFIGTLIVEQRKAFQKGDQVEHARPDLGLAPINQIMLIKEG